MLENYLECYHCAVAHPSFSAAIDVRQENYHLTVHGWLLAQVGQVRPSALEGRSQVKIYDVGGEVAQSQYHVLWPNMTININPGFPNLSIDVWMPDGPNATKGLFRTVFRARRHRGIRAGADRLQQGGRRRGRGAGQFGAARAVGRHSRSRPVSDEQRASRRPFPEADRRCFERPAGNAGGRQPRSQPRRCRARSRCCPTPPPRPTANATPMSISKSSRSSRKARSSARSICAAPTASRSTRGSPGQFLPIRVTIPGQPQTGAANLYSCRRCRTPITTGCRSGAATATRWSPASCTPTRSRACASRR